VNKTERIVCNTVVLTKYIYVQWMEVKICTTAYSNRPNSKDKCAAKICPFQFKVKSSRNVHIWIAEFCFIEIMENDGSSSTFPTLDSMR
jgi:hypothetical protein